MAKKKGGKGSKKEGAFWRRYEGALDAGYPSDEAAAIAHGGSNRESRERNLKEAFRRGRKTMRK